MHGAVRAARLTNAMQTLDRYLDDTVHEFTHAHTQKPQLSGRGRNADRVWTRIGRSVRPQAARISCRQRDGGGESSFAGGVRGNSCVPWKLQNGLRCKKATRRRSHRKHEPCQLAHTHTHPHKHSVCGYTKHKRHVWVGLQRRQRHVDGQSMSESRSAQPKMSTICYAIWAVVIKVAIFTTPYICERREYNAHI